MLRWLTGMLLREFGRCAHVAVTAVAQGRLPAQASAACGAQGLSRGGPAVGRGAGTGWELRQDVCAPGVAGAIGCGGARRVLRLTARDGVAGSEGVRRRCSHCWCAPGDRVRLWSQDETVRIEMSGVVEQSARGGERVVVQVARQSEDRA